MALSFHPEPGVLVICDFSGFKAPEMVKRRPAVVISPRLRQRDNLCTIVPLSTTAPRSVCNFHCRLRFDPRMPDPYGEEWMWVKADMVSAVSFARLSLPYEGRDLQGKRVYEVRKISDQDFQTVKACVLHALGMGHLTPHL